MAKPPSPKRPASKSEDLVFLNVPYDPSFAPSFLAYVCGICAFGLIPRATLELQGGAEAAGWHRFSHRELPILHSRYVAGGIGHLRHLQRLGLICRLNSGFRFYTQAAIREETPGSCLNQSNGGSRSRSRI